MVSWDAVVAGASVAGSMTARELARRGLRVALVERARFPRPKACGEGLLPHGLAALREAGLDDGQIFAVTTFVALRLAFSTVNDALGAQPDAPLAAALPPEVREAVTFGRPPAT